MVMDRSAEIGNSLHEYMPGLHQFVKYPPAIFDWALLLHSVVTTGSANVIAVCENYPITLFLIVAEGAKELVFRYELLYAFGKKAFEFGESAQCLFYCFDNAHSRRFKILLFGFPYAMGGGGILVPRSV